MLRYDRDLSLGPLVDATDIRPPHLPHPERLTPEGSHTQVTGTFRAWVFEHAQRRPQQHVDAQTAQFLPHNLAYALSVAQIPGGPQRHLRGQRCHPADDAGERHAVALVVHGDKERDERTGRCSFHDERLGHRLRSIPGGLLELTDQCGHLSGRVTLVDDVAVVGQKHYPADVIIVDQFCDDTILGNLGPRESGQEKLPHLGRAGHTFHQPRDLVFLLRTAHLERHERYQYGDHKGQCSQSFQLLSHLLRDDADCDGQDNVVITRPGQDSPGSRFVQANHDPRRPSVGGVVEGQQMRVYDGLTGGPSGRGTGTACRSTIVLRDEVTIPCQEMSEYHVVHRAGPLQYPPVEGERQRLCRGDRGGRQAITDQCRKVAETDV